MPIHDWTRVSAGVFHDFHNTWIVELKNALNGGVLPAGYYAMSEQREGLVEVDVLTLSTRPAGHAQPDGATAVAEIPPKVSLTMTVDEPAAYARRRRTLAIRHTSDHRIVALVEIVSPGNKDSRRALHDFVEKSIAAIARGHHLLVVDLNPPGSHDPDGIHGAIWSELASTPYTAPADRPLTLAAYMAGPLPEAFVEPVAIGMPLPDMPLFLDADWYVNVPLDRTYEAAFRGVPEVWRQVLNAHGS